MADENHGAMESYVLDFGGTDLHSWRLREEPYLDAGEIGEFHHGDTIVAVRDAAHPGWLKLAEKAGWVKESHEDYLVWKMAKFRDPEPAACASPTADSRSKSSKDCGKTNSFAPSKASSSGSEGSSAEKDRALAEAKPAFPFMGQGYRLTDEGGACISGTCTEEDAAAIKAEASRWFVGQSYRIGPMGLKKSGAAVDAIVPVPRAARPRWADMADTDEEEAEREPMSLSRLEGSPLDSDGGEPEEEETEGWSDMALLPGGEPEPEKQCTHKARRKRRNKAVLQKRGKLQLCQHFIGEGFCQFGNSCWFAHSDAELNRALMSEQALQARGGVSEENLERIAPTRSQAPPSNLGKAAEQTPSVARPRWADTLDTDEEDAGSDKECPDPQMARKEEDAKPFEQQVVVLQTELGQEPEQEPESRQHCTEVSRRENRKKRNRELLLRRGKTQLCRYLTGHGSCPFGEACWFAHSEAELQASDAVGEKAS